VWEDLKDESVKKLLDTVHIYHNNTDAKRVTGTVEGYIHHIDISQIKHELIEVDGSSIEREVLWIGKGKLPIKKVEKVTSKFVAEYRGPNADQKDPENKINDSRVQQESVDENIQEGYLFTTKDLELNMDKWPNDKNILFVTGHSGSGKTTLAENIADEVKGTVIQLDWFACNHMIMGWKDFREQDYGVKLVIKYFTDIRPELNNKDKGSPDHKDVMNMDDETYDQEFKKFWEWIFNEMKKDSKRPYVVEGLQILRYIDIESIIDYPFIIKNTSALLSMIHRNKRDKDKDNDDNHYNNGIKWYIQIEKGLKVLRKHLQQSIQENVSDDEDIIIQEGLLLGLAIAGGVVLVGLIVALIFRFIKMNKLLGYRMNDSKMLLGKSDIIPQEIRKTVIEYSKDKQIPFIFVKNQSSCFTTMKLKSVLKLAGDNKLNCANPHILEKCSNEQDVILIDVNSFNKMQHMENQENILIVLKHEYGHYLTKNKSKMDHAEYSIKTSIINTILNRSDNIKLKCILIRIYFELEPEKLANEAGGVTGDQMASISKGYKQVQDWDKIFLYEYFINEKVPDDVLKKVYSLNNKVVSDYIENVISRFNSTVGNIKQESTVIVQEADVSNKRKLIEDKVFKVFMTLDPTGINAKKYQQMFGQMSDAQFKKWIEAFLADPKSGFRWDIEEFGDGSRKPKFENIDKAAGLLGIKLFEHVYMPHVSSNPNRPVRTKLPVLVGKLPIKRTQQFVSKKTNMSLSDTNRDDMTGVAKGESKAGTSTGIENELLQGVGGDIILKEIIGARADNQEEYANMIQQIAETGSVNVLDIKTSVYDKGALLKADLYLMAMGIKTDMISESYYSIEKVRAATRK